MKRTHRFFFELHIGLALAILLSGYQSTVHGQRLDKRRPGVYLNFKELARTNDGEEGVRLNLNNNTQWPIVFTRIMESTLKNDISVSYIIEMPTGCYDERLKTDVVMKTKLMPNKTVSFVVPKEDFQNERRIYVPFSYSWEIGSDDQTHRNEASHRAYFSSRDLPRN